MNVLLRAPLLTNSGYGVHSRQIFEWLNSKKNINLYIECLNWGTTSWIVNPKLEEGLIGKIMNHSKDFKEKYDLAIQVQLPDEWDPNLGKKNIGITAAVETDRCNPKWADCCNKMDVVVVPSIFSKNVLKNSGFIKTNIKVIPEWFNNNINNKKEINKIIKNDKRYKFGSKFNFLTIAQLTSLRPNEDRKNLENTIRWFIEEFKNNKDVGLVIKTNSGKSTIFDNHLTTSKIKEIIKNYRKDSIYPKIHFIHGQMTSKEIAAIYNVNNVKSYISATRGEGYGLPVVDAAACAMPIIITGWSGHYEYLDRKYTTNVDYNLINIPDSKVDNRIFFKGFQWAEPSEASFKRGLRKVFNNYNNCLSKAQVMKKDIVKNFSKNKICTMYEKLFREVLGVE